MPQAIAAPPKEQEQGPSYVGDGNYTANMLSTWSGIEKRLITQGCRQPELDFIYATAICPKGHDDHLNQTAAAKKYFPVVEPITAKCRALNTLIIFMQQLFSGQHIEECQKKWNETHKKPVNEGTRPRLSNDAKAERIAKQQLKAAFRHDHIPQIGGRGRLKPEVQKEQDRYMEKHLLNAIKVITAKLEEGD